MQNVRELASANEAHHHPQWILNAWCPSDAIITLDNQSKVYVVRDNKAVEVFINKGFVEEQLTEISGEIAEGDRVVINGQHNLKADTLVEVLNSENIPALSEQQSTVDSAIVKAH